MKWLGTLLVLASALAFGNRFCAEKKRHMHLLRDLLESLELLQGELELRSAPIPELLHSLSEKASDDAGLFLGQVCEGFSRLGEDSFARIWSEAAASSLTLLLPGERDELVRLGAVLGSLDLEAQLRSLRFSSGFLRARLEEERKTYPVKRRLTLGLCASAAALTIILSL